MGDDSVEVSPEQLQMWGFRVMTDVVGEQAGLSTAYSGISVNAQAGFNTFAMSAGVFKEGTTVFNITKRNMDEFKSFLADVATGAQSIQSASLSMAVAYATTDGEAAKDLSAVDFAFADGGKIPDGFPVDKNGNVTTMSEARAAASGSSTDAGLAVDNPELLKFATHTQAVDGGTLYTFADGSQLRITTTGSGSSYISQKTTTQSVYKPGEKNPSSVTTTGESYDYSGQKTTSKTTEVTGADGKVTTSGQSVTNLSGGGQSVTTTTTGVDGKTSTSTTEVKPAKPTEPTDVGALDQLEGKYHSTGAGGSSWQ
jgi:hypothetical protein